MSQVIEGFAAGGGAGCGFGLDFGRFAGMRYSPEGVALRGVGYWTFRPWIGL
jgi:hypothetical protein